MENYGKQAHNSQHTDSSSRPGLDLATALRAASRIRLFEKGKPTAAGGALGELG